MASVAEMVKIKTVDINIDKAVREVKALKSKDTTNVVTFKADETCRVEFLNTRVFGMKSIFLEKNKPRELTVVESNQETDWNVYLPETPTGNVMTATEQVVPMKAQTEEVLTNVKPWPILP